MRPVSELYGRHTGEDIYVVGTGASMRVFPPDFLEGKVTIGLNMAWRVAPIRYGLTIGPHLNIPELMGNEDSRPEITWITKRGKAKAVLTPEQFARVDADPRYYAFEARGRPNTAPLEEPSDEGRMLDWVREPVEDSLYQWSSISQTGVNLAANLGARNVILVGCDNCALADNHHAHRQHTKWMGATPERRYEQYYEGLAEVRRAARERGVNVMSLTPFVKLDDPERDFRALCQELERPQHLRGEDISHRDHPSRFLKRDAPSAPDLAVRKLRAAGRRLSRALR